MFPDGGISAIGQWTCLLGTQPSHIELVSTECLSPGPAVQYATHNHYMKCTVLKQSYSNLDSNYFLLGLEGAETVLDNTPDNLKIVEKEKRNGTIEL